jgi:hypothetical protein
MLNKKNNVWTGTCFLMSRGYKIVGNLQAAWGSKTVRKLQAGSRKKPTLASHLAKF